MGKNIVERAVSPYNATNRAIQHETYGLFAPAANVNKPGMAGFDPRYFAVREQIVELSQAFLETIQPIRREVPEQGIDDILEINCIYMNVSAGVVDTILANGELEYIDVTGSLMVFGTEAAQTQVLFAEGRIWIREVTRTDDELLVDEFMPIGYDETINERFIEIEDEIAGCVSSIEDIVEILGSIPTIIREVPEQGINGMLERNSLYVDVFTRIKTSTYDSGGNHSPVLTSMMGSLMVFGTESVQTQVFFANGGIWTRKITQQGDEVIVGVFEPIASKDKVELLDARVADLNATVYDNTHTIPEVYDTIDQMPDGDDWWNGYYITFGKDYLCRIPEGEPTPTEFKMLVEVHTGSEPAWFTIINDPENTDGSRFCTFRIERFEYSTVTFRFNGVVHERTYEYESGISSTTAILYCNYEVFSEENGLPTFEYIYPLKNHIKALEKRIHVFETDIENIKTEINNSVAYLSDAISGVYDDFSQVLSEVGARIDVVEERLDNAITAEQVRDIVEEQVRDIVELTDGIPSYWQTHLTERVEDIRRAMETAGRNKSSFFFYSDSHWSNENTYTAKLAPTLLKYLYKNTPINKTNYGGDIVSAESTDTDIMAYLWDWRAQLRGLPNHHSVVGNHDDGNSTDRLLSKEYIYSYLLAPEESNEIVWGGDFYYYIDDKSEKTRYLYLDIFYDGVSSTQITFVTEALKTTPTDWHIVAISHAWFANDYSVYPPVLNGFDTTAKTLLDMFDNYNARGGEYGDCGGWVELCIGGHYHLDHYDHTDGGIPVIIVEADTLHDRSGTMPSKETTDEAAVSAVVVDYNSNKVKVIRVGRGESYDVPINISRISYTNVLPLALAVDGTSVYNGIGYKADTRWSESGQAESTSAGDYLTGYIPVSNGDIIYCKNIDFTYADYGSSGKVLWSNALGSTLGSVNGAMLIEYNSATWHADGTIASFVVNGDYSYIRIQCKGITEASIITINEEIPEPEQDNPTYTNVIKTSIGTDGEIFNGGKGWADNSRIGSGGIYLGNGSYYVTGHIEIDRTADITVYLKNVTFGANGAVAFFDSSFVRTDIDGTTNWITLDPLKTYYNAVVDDSGNLTQFTIPVSKMTNENIAYMAIQADYIGDNSIITINEPIE